MIKELIRREVERVYPEVVKLRREIHMRPELGMETFRTVDLVSSVLQEAGVQVRKAAGGAGAVALIKGAKPGRCVALRADMDALPIEEENDVPYRSKVKGVMHACGHDAHTAMLVGVGIVLNSLREHLHGLVKLIFQPGEEVGKGALAMIEDGVMDDPKVEMIFAQHVWTELEVGRIGVREGACMASMDEVKVEIEGVGGHGAYPHLTRDPIVAAAYLITQLQTVVSRTISPLESAVVSICRVQGGTTFNVIPSKVELQGTLRSLEENVREKVIERIEAILKGIEMGMEVKCRLKCRRGSPVVYNDSGLTRLVREVGEEVLGEGRVEEVDPTMGGEDFAFYLQRAPGVFYRLGIKSEGFENKKIHSPTFDLPEEAMKVGVEVMVNLAFKAGSA